MKILEVYNQHADGCGTPPSLVAANDRDSYVGYFENFYGEQWLFQWSPEVPDAATVWGGDIEWEKPFEINVARSKPDMNVLSGRGDRPIPLMSQAERSWLLACVATARKRHDALFQGARGGPE